LGNVEGMLKAKGADVATRVKALDERSAGQWWQLRRGLRWTAQDEDQAKTINGIAF
jgi:hypothetical protein